MKRCENGAWLDHWPPSAQDPPSGYVEERLASYLNPKLGDTVKRLCRDPLRKLEPQDRLLGPVRFICRYAEKANDVPPLGMLMAIVAAMRYAGELSEGLDRLALRKRVLSELHVDSRLLDDAEEALAEFSSKGAAARATNLALVRRSRPSSTRPIAAAPSPNTGT